MAHLWLENLREAFTKVGANPSILIKGKALKYFLLGGFAVGSPLATYFTTAHILNSRNQRILEEKEKELETLLSEKIITPEDNKVEEKKETADVRVREEKPAVDNNWAQREKQFKSQIEAIENSKRKLESRIKRKIWDVSEILTPGGLDFFRRSKYVSSWDNLRRVESTGSNLHNKLFSSSMHFEETYDFFWNYNSYEYSSGNGPMKYLIPNDWSLLRSSAKIRLYFFLLNPFTEIRNIVEALREPHLGSGHSSFNQLSILNEYMKPFEDEKTKMKSWNRKISVQFLSNSCYHNVFNSPLHPSSHGWWSGNYKIKPIEDLDIGEIFRGEENIQIALKILFFLHLTSQYSLAKTLKNHVSFGIENTKNAALSFFTNLYNNRLTLKTNNFPSAESFLNYLILKSLEYKNNFGKVNLKDSVHPALFPQ